MDTLGPVLEGPVEAVTVLFANSQTGVTTLTGFAFAGSLGEHDIEPLLCDAMSQAFVHALSFKCTRLEIDATLSTQPLDRVLARMGGRPGDQPGIWLAQPQPEKMLEEARQFNKGKGSWHVVVHNDDVTPMDVVASTLEHGAGCNTELA